MIKMFELKSVLAGGLTVQVVDRTGNEVYSGVASDIPDMFDDCEIFMVNPLINMVLAIVLESEVYDRW